MDNSERKEAPAIAGGKKIFDAVIPIAKPDLPPFEEIEENLKETFNTGMITNHKYVRSFEKELANYLGVKYVACVSSGTTALLLVLKALNITGEVLIPSFTFSATAHAVKWCGLDPKFVEVDKETFNLNPKCVEAAITPRTSAILGVHVFGNPCKIKELENIAKKHNLKLIFDAAHALGTMYQDKHIGTFGDAEIFSLTPTKVLTSGEGGIVTTNNKEIYDRVALDREYGKMPDYDCKTIGLNGRMTEWSAIIGLANLKCLEQRIQRRFELTELYKQNLAGVEGVTFQKLDKDARCSLKDFPILIDENTLRVNRDQLAEALTAENIRWRKYFFPPVHLETVYREEDHSVVLPITEYISKNILTLPLFVSMANGDVVRVCNAIKRIAQWNRK